MSGKDTKELRLEYHNQWPVTFRFPAEQRLMLHLKELNLAVPFVTAPLKNSEQRDFHLMLSSLLDALDMLPLRPDRAFESIWTALDAEMVALATRLKPANSPSRFQVLMQHIEQTFKGDSSLCGMIDFMNHVPLQSCEYVAARILEAMNQPGDHSEYFLKKIKPAMGAELLDAFNNKYGPPWLAATGEKQGLIQRKAGAFLRKLLTGAAVTISPLADHVLPAIQRLRFYVYAVLPNVRNERFHGLSFSSYRSSAAQMKTYAAGYFLFLIAYHLILHVFLYRGFNVLSAEDASKAVQVNSKLYTQVFGKFAGD